MRQQIGLRSDNVDESLLYANMIQQKNALELIQAKLGQNTTSSVSSNTGTSGPDKEQKVSGTAKNTISPTNQHGTSSVNIKESLSKKTKKNIEKYKKNFASVYKRYHVARNEICEQDNSDITTILALTRDSISKDLANRIQAEASNGMLKALKDSNSNIFLNKKIIISELTNKMNKTLNNIFKDIHKKIKNEAKSNEEKIAIFDAIEYRIRFLSESIVLKSYWYAYVKACHQLHIAKVYIKFNSEKDSKNHKTIIDTNKFTLDDIPPYNAYCSCKIFQERRDSK